MKYTDLRDFMHQLEALGELKRIPQPLSPRLEITEVADRVLRAGGPALLIEHPVEDGKPHEMPVLANLFGTPRRVALGMGEESTEALREVGHRGKFVERHFPAARAFDEHMFVLLRKLVKPGDDFVQLKAAVFHQGGGVGRGGNLEPDRIDLLDGQTFAAGIGEMDGVIT